VSTNEPLIVDPEHSSGPRTPRRRSRLRRWLLIPLAVLGVILFIVAFALWLTTPPEREATAGWSEAAAMPVARGEGSAALGAVGEGCNEPPCPAIIVVGGLSFPFRTESRVDAYLLDEEHWVSLPDLPGARHHLAAAALPDGTVVVSGGAPSVVDWSPTDDVWALEPGASGWAVFEPLPEPRWGHRLVAVGDRLVAVGGQEGDATFVWSEDDGWTAGAPIPEIRDHLGAVAVDGEVWVIGGRNEGLTDRVDIYDPDDDAWRSGPALPEPTSGVAVGVIDRTLVAVSGEDDSLLSGGIVRDSWMLDLDNVDAGWSALAPPPMDLHGAGDAVAGEGDEARLFVLGGASRHGALSALAWNDRVFVLESPLPLDE
jgi:hypothetical protein